MTTTESFIQQDSSEDTPKARNHCLKILGLNNSATSAEIEKAYTYLVSDIRPSKDAKHSRVTAAHQLLEEVEMAYRSLAA